MRSLLAISRFFDFVNVKVTQLVIWLTLLMAVVSAMNATYRKVFNDSSNAWLEIQWYLFGAVFLLAGGYTFLKNAHVRVDVINSRLKERTQVIIDLICVLFFLFPACGLIVYLSWPFFMKAYVTGEMSNNTGGLIRWPVKLLIPIGFSLMITAGLSHVIKCVAFLKGMAPNPLRKDKSSDEELLEELKEESEGNNNNNNEK